ncbi:PilZ domain-containing protein, partial [Azospirillum sp. TSO22-1]|uniref:PilZ domain-containing protein n=1 Tax=Azospirillum sp. TSO22-1 TaxID=716789 RepID=UPI000D60F077
DAAPPRPPEPHERRRQKRYVRPAILVRSARGEHRARNWSIGGLCVQATDLPWKHGDLVDLRLSLAGQPDVTADAQVVVVHVNRGKEQISVRFQSYRDELKALLKTAFLEHQKLVG